MALAEAGKTAEANIEPWLSGRTGDGRLTLSLGGPWTTAHITRLSRELTKIGAEGSRNVVFDLAQVSELDTAGAWVISSAQRQFENAGLKVALEGASEGVNGLIETVSAHHVVTPPPPKPVNPLIAILIRLGKGTYDFLGEGRDLLSFLGYTVIVFGRSILQP